MDQIKNTVFHLFPCHKNEHSRGEKNNLNILKNYMQISNATGDVSFLMLLQMHIFYYLVSIEHEGYTKKCINTSLRQL